MSAPEPVPSEASARHLPRDQRRVVPPPLFEGDPRLTRPRPEWLRKVVPPPQPMLPPLPDTRPDWLRRIVPPPEPRSAPVRPPDFRAADALHEAQRKGMDLAMRLSTPEGRSAVTHGALGSLDGQPKRSGMAVLAAWAEANGIGAKLSDAGTATVAAARAASPTSPQPASPRISDTEAAARFKAAAWAAHDSALSPEEYATREYRLKVSDAARAAKVARRAIGMGARPERGRSASYDDNVTNMLPSLRIVIPSDYYESRT